MVPPPRVVTLRIVALATVAMFANAYWVLQVEGIWHTNHATAMSLFWNALFFLMLLILANLFVLKPYFPRKAFTQGELLTFYIMLNIGTALVGHDSLQLGMPAVMGFPIWFQSQQPDMGWDRFNRFFPDWAMVKDLNILRPVHYGNATRLLYTPEHLRAWAVPVLVWCGFIVALGTVLLCQAQLLRKQWTESEKLSYPIVTLPLAMTEGGGTKQFFLQRVFWAGMLGGLGLDLWNGLSVLYPAIPRLLVRHDAPGHDLGPFLASFGYPWDQAGSIPVPLYPFIVALGYFLPLDLSFSLWFFFLVKIALRVVAATIGVAPGQLSSFPYFAQQTVGAWLAICLGAAWMARRHLREVWIKVVEPRASTLDDAAEPISYRVAVLGIFLGLAYIAGFCLAAGMTPLVIGLYFGFFFLISMGIARLRAELGPPAHEMAGGLDGTSVLNLFLGSQAVGLPNLTMLSMFWWFSGRGFRSNLAPVFLEGMKLQQAGPKSMRGLGWAILWALLIGGLSSFWAGLHLQYTAGINKMTDHNWGQFQLVASFAGTPRPPDYTGQLAVGVGGALAVGMMAMRARFPWWPFHPAGYAISMTFGGEYYWSCLMLATLIKWGILRYGGWRLHRQAMQFCFGLILGEYAMGAFWSLLSLFLNDGRIVHISTYDFAPG